jgi:hypothetical protein
MSQASNQMVKSLLAGASFASKQYFAVQMTSTDNTVIVAGAAAAEGSHVVGIIQNEPGSGEAASVAIGGTSKLSMAAACDQGEKIKSDGNGEGTPVDADQKSVIGIALEASDGNGSIIEVLLTPGGVAQADESN